MRSIFAIAVLVVGIMWLMDMAVDGLSAEYEKALSHEAASIVSKKFNMTDEERSASVVLSSIEKQDGKTDVKVCLVFLDEKTRLRIPETESCNTQTIDEASPRYTALARANNTAANAIERIKTIVKK